MPEPFPPRFGFELKAGAALADWDAIATSWHAGLERTVARCHGLDAPFCHNEHGNMHALMVGAEMSGLSTLREVVGNRGDVKRQCYLDGCFVGDAFVDLVEAKSSEDPLMPDGQLPKEKFERVRNLMRDAIKDADRYTNPHPMYAKFHLPRRRIGIVFSSGWFKDEPSQELGAEQPWLVNRLEQLRALEPDFMAWSFPAAARGLRYYRRHYPGVVLLGTLVRTEQAEGLTVA